MRECTARDRVWRVELDSAKLGGKEGHCFSVESCAVEESRASATTAATEFEIRKAHTTSFCLLLNLMCKVHTTSLAYILNFKSKSYD